MPHTILLVDDHPVFRQGLRLLLEKEKDLKVVGEAGDGLEAIDRLRDLSPDIVVMDINMPNLDGIEATHQILAESPDTRVVALSVHSGKRFVRDMLQAGAAGYILKESVPEEMIQGIRTVLEGDVYLSAAISGIVVSEYRKLLSKAGPEEDSPPRERIFRTKLHRPPVSADIIPRARLIELLEHGRHRPLTLITAPAGYGKSVLASQWLEICGCPGAWLSLDENDSNLRQFLTYLLEALQGMFPSVELKTGTFLQAVNLPPVKVLAHNLLNDVEEVKEPFILVLDDYHCIREEAIHNLLTELLRYPSPMLHLTLLTRRDPPLPIGPMRAGGQLTEITMESLRFTVSETKAFLERLFDVSPDENTVSVLEEKLEGWGAGLRLAALSMGREGKSDFIMKDLGEGASFIHEYLMQEVLLQVPPAFASFLIESSMLERFCAPLCSAVHLYEGQPGGEKTGGQDFIDWLEKTHLFVVPLDEPHYWFRYHHLFQQLLQRQLELHHSPEEIAAFHSRAADWFVENGLIEEAIKHLLDVGDALAAAQIVERNRHAALDNDQWHTLKKWLDRLPHEIKQERPDLLLGVAWILLQMARVAEIFPIMERIEALVDVDAMEPALLSEINFFKGLLCYLRDEGADSVELFTRSTEQLPKDSFVALRSQAEYWLCMALHLNGQKEKAIRRLHEGIRSRDLQEGMILSRLAFGLCFIHMLDGDCLQAFQEGLRLREVCRSNQLAFAETWGMYVLGNASFQMFDLDAALHHFNLVIENRYIKNPRAAIDAMAGLTITSHFMGKPDEADETMRLAQEYAQWTKDPGHLKIVHSCQARLALLRGDVDLASRWQKSLSEGQGNLMILFFLEIPAITECRVLIAIGSDASLKEAIERIEGLLQNSKAWHNTCQILDIMVLQAMASQRQGRLEDALDVLEKAVAMAAPGRCMRAFVELGPPMADLLRRLHKQDATADYVEEILAAFPLHPTPSLSRRSAEREGRSPRPQPLVEPLTNRELDILELLAQRLQTKEIAEKLYISSETVKSHLKNIYQKLGVSNRREAVEKARELGILTAS